METVGASLAARRGRAVSVFLFIAAGMMGVGLFFSYSRGAWLGTAVGLLYLAKAYGKFKWRYVLPALLWLGGVVLFWGRHAGQCAVVYEAAGFRQGVGAASGRAWKAGFEMMRDHPFGVGWNKAVGVYEKNYSPPEDGAAAITMNDYLMLGTELGLPGLFVLWRMWGCAD